MGFGALDPSAVSRLVVWGANAALLVLCGFLALDIAEQVAAATRPVEDAPLPGRRSAPAPGGERDPAVIVERGLFDVTRLAPPEPPPPPPVEEIEETELPLVLLGTAAATQSEGSWAVVGNLESREQHVVQVGDALPSDARVAAIERRRLVLDEGDGRSELVLDGDEGRQFFGPSKPKPRKPRRRGPRRSRPRRR